MLLDCALRPVVQIDRRGPRPRIVEICEDIVTTPAKNQRNALADKNEYDFTLDYRFTSKQWPEWLRPLWVRARAVRVEDKLNGATDVTTDYRIIVNYEWVFD